MNSLLLGVIGHVDHGKTALVRALTGTETDRLREEQERGVSIVLGFALMKTPAGEIDLIDMPGHEQFVRAMISGATGISAVLLTVAANEGVKPQTVEHLEIARLIGVRQGVVALTKCDLVAADEIATRAAEIERLAAAAGIETGPAIATSTKSGQGLDELAARLAALVGAAQPRRDDGFFYLPVDRAFQRPGFGTVVTGTLRRGSLAVGQEVEVVPGGLRAEVRGIQSHGRQVKVAGPGKRVAVSLRRGDPSILTRGVALASPGMLAESRWVDVEIEAASNAPRALRTGDRVRFLSGTLETSARVRLLDREELLPGDRAVGQVHCGTEIAVPSREPFLVRLESPAATMGGGRILSPTSRRLRRMDKDVVADLVALGQARPSDLLLSRLRKAGAEGHSAGAFAALLGIAPDRVRRRLAEIGAREIDGRFVDDGVLVDLKSGIREALAKHHREHPIEHGMTQAMLVQCLQVRSETAACAIRDLAEAKAIVQDRGALRLAEFDPSRNESRATAVVQARFRDGGLAPPDEAAGLAGVAGGREALAYLLRAGIVIRAVDRAQKRAIIFHRDAIEDARRSIGQALSGPEGFAVGDAGTLLGISRKYSVPLLEYLDSLRFTRRMGDRRMVIPLPPTAVPAEAGQEIAGSI